MRYVEARIKHEVREEAYRIYVADGLYAMSRTLAKSESSFLDIRFSDIINPKAADERTVEDIVRDIWKKIEG